MTTSFTSLNSSKKILKSVHPDLKELAKERAKGTFQFFCRYITREFWKPYKHFEYLCDILEQVEQKEIRRLTLNMPPQHGKSVTTSELFPV